MVDRVDLLVNTNLVRHIKSKVDKFDEIIQLSSKLSNPLLLESMLPTVISYFDAAIMDTIREYVYARSFEIYDFIIEEQNNKLLSRINKEELKKVEFKDYLIEQFLKDVEYKEIKEKLLKLKKLCKIEFDLGNETWESIVETIARRNCLIHNDLIANTTYFRQAGNKKDNTKPGKRLVISSSYLVEQINFIKKLLLEIKERIEIQFTQNTNVSVLKNLWDYLFENDYPLIFNNCWKIEGKYIKYIGPKLNDLCDATSPRIICLFTVWMTFFNCYSYPDVKYFADMFYISAEERETYSRKLKTLIDCFEKIDFQSFNVVVYDKI